MNQITTRYITENGACYEQYVITDPEAKTALTITPERGGMITSFTLDGEEFVWTTALPPCAHGKWKALARTA